MATTRTPLNRVDIGAVAALVQTIQNRPEAAQTRWAATVRWTGAFSSEAQVRHFEPIASDDHTRTRTSCSPVRRWTADGRGS